MELHPIEEAQAPTAEWHREERLHGTGSGTLHCSRERAGGEFGSKKIFARCSCGCEARNSALRPARMLDGMLVKCGEKMVLHRDSWHSHRRISKIREIRFLQ
jgi:hypothetical protein